MIQVKRRIMRKYEVQVLIWCIGIASLYILAPVSGLLATIAGALERKLAVLIFELETLKAK